MSAAFASQFWPNLLSAVIGAVLIAVFFWFVALPSRAAKKIIDEAGKRADVAAERTETVRKETFDLIGHLQEERRQDRELIVHLDKSYKESVVLTNHLIAQLSELNEQVETLKQKNEVKEEVIAGLRRQVKGLQEDKNRLLKEAKAAKGKEADCQERLAEHVAKLQGEIETVRAEVQAVAA